MWRITSESSFTSRSTERRGSTMFEMDPWPTHGSHIIHRTTKNEHHTTPLSMLASNEKIDFNGVETKASQPYYLERF
jgi:hypothetical protein